MEFVKIGPNHYDAVIEHLRLFFFADEPLNKSVNLCSRGQGHVELEKHSLITLEDGLSVMAISPNQEIAGVCLNGVLLDGDLKSALEKLNENGDKEFQKIFNLLYGESLKLDLFERLNVDKIFEVRILSVDEKFRGHGIAKNLMLKSQEIAEENGFRVLKSDATGLFSQRVNESLGFVTCVEIRYDDYKDENNCQVFVVDAPHECLKIMYKVLDEEEVTTF